jgi:F0F1-type ATP synthase membrane subunit b/b'
MSQRNLTEWTKRIAGQVIVVLWLSGTCGLALSQPATSDSVETRIRQLSDAMNRAQKQIEQSQHELDELRAQMTALQQQISSSGTAAAPDDAARLSAAVEQIREQQSLEESQIATHEQSKVESESKYPLKLSGLVLLTGFANTKQVDDPVSPSIVLSGGGSTGASLTQTVLGFDARGPHLLNAESHADLRIDFAGAALSGGNAASAYSGGLVRLRTAHADLQWQHTRAFFALDRTILSPNMPSSLTAVAVPALGWSGNLWTWNPQVGFTQDFAFSSAQRFRIQAATIDVMNPVQIYGGGAGSAPAQLTPPSTAEMSRWPGAEGRLALLSGTDDSGLQLGIGGLFAPHRSVGGTRFNSWAGTLDYRIPFGKRAEVSGSGYWGEALGGLGGGAFKDYVFGPDPLSPSGYSFVDLHAIGGWFQFKAHANQHLEFNAATGTDQVPAVELRPYAGNASAYYLNLARNLTYTGNVIYSPSAYLLFSLEYRHLQSAPVNDYSATGDIIGIAAGYRF